MSKELNHQQILSDLLKRAVGTVFQAAQALEAFRMNPIEADKEKMERISVACLTLNDVLSIVHDDLLELLPDLKKEQVDYLKEVQRKHLELIKASNSEEAKRLEQEAADRAEFEKWKAERAAAKASEEEAAG